MQRSSREKNASFIYHFTDSFILHITEFSVAATAALVYRGAVVRTCHSTCSASPKDPILAKYVKNVISFIA